MNATIDRGSPWRLALWAVPTVLLSIPAVMTAISAEGWLWSPFDFVVAGVLLFGAAGLVDLAIRKGGSGAYRFGAALAVLTAFLLIWINGAVGVIGDEGNPANLLFLAIVGLAAAGAALARFRARGMALAMLTVCVLIAGIAAAAPLLGWGAGEPPGTTGLVMLISGFAAMWGLSAALFAKAAAAPQG